MRNWSTVRTPILVTTALALCAGVSQAATQATPTQPVGESAVDPGAKDALTRMGARLKSLSVFAIDESITREQVINGDLKVQKSSSAHVLVHRPDGLKADVSGDDGKSHSIFFDGKTMTVYMPRQSYYAQMDAPGPVGAAMDKAEDAYGVDFPASDFLRMASGEDLSDKLTAAGDVGESSVGGTVCEHYAYRTADVDYQLWIEEGQPDGPLPRRLVITSKKQPTQPEYTAVLTWDVSPTVYASSFKFTPPEGTTKIAFGRAGTQPKGK
jgi:hypothetical protein